MSASMVAAAAAAKAEGIALSEETLKATSVVFTEVLFDQFYEGQADFSAMLEFMRDRGFRFVEFASESRMPPLGELAYADAVFVKQSSAARR